MALKSENQVNRIIDVTADIVREIVAGNAYKVVRDHTDKAGQGSWPAVQVLVADKPWTTAPEWSRAALSTNFNLRPAPSIQRMIANAAPQAAIPPPVKEDIDRLFHALLVTKYRFCWHASP